MLFDKFSITESENIECSFHFGGYKCFEESTKIESLEQNNIIIGKNNTGKSSLIDVFDFLINLQNKGHQFPSLINSIDPSNISVQYKVKPDEYNQNIFSTLDKGAVCRECIREHQDFVFEVRFDKNFTKPIELYTNSQKEIQQKELMFEHIINKSSSLFKLFDFQGRSLLRLSAERDILPESCNGNNPVKSIGRSGRNTTELFYDYLINANRNIYLITNDLLNGLNQVYSEEGTFSAIYVRNSKPGSHEIYLEELNKKETLIPLSKSGSGLKTVILVLTYLHILPDLLNTPTSACIFAFEELENNLHPSIQRKLFKYIRDFTAKSECMLFLSTHSNVAIDIFSNSKNTQIIHTIQNQGSTKLSILESNRMGLILDDLGYKASDILLSNYIVWVEGPSDRIYINAWIKLIDSNLEEGVHYSIMFYGGRLLSHLSYEIESEESINEFIDLSKINRNSCIILDSDKTNKDEKLNSTKQRIIDEFTKNNQFYLVTEGREIENYLPQNHINNAFKEAHPELSKTKSIKWSQFGSLTSINKPSEKTKYFNKVAVAKNIISLVKSIDEYELSLSSSIISLVSNIKEANGSG